MRVRSRAPRELVSQVASFVVHGHELSPMLTAWLVARTGKKAVKAACLGELSTRKALGTHSCYSLTSPRVLSLQSLRGASGRSQKHPTKAIEMLIKVSAVCAAWFCVTEGKGVRENGKVRPKWATSDSDRTHGASDCLPECQVPE